MPKSVLQCIGGGSLHTLYEQPTSTGVIAVTQGCCEADCKSSPELWGVHFAEVKVAVH